VIDLAQARDVLATLEQRIAKGERRLEPLVPGVGIEIAIAAAENEAIPPDVAESCDSLFRVRTRRWAVADGDLPGLVPRRDPRLRVLEFDYDVADFMQVRTLADLPASPTPRRSHIVAFAGSNGDRRHPVVVDGTTADVLKLSDGTRTALEIAGELARPRGRSSEAANLKWIEGLLLHGLISLQDDRLPMSQALHSLGASARSHRSAQRRSNRRSRG
jgi:hypothetical protein